MNRITCELAEVSHVLRFPATCYNSYIYTMNHKKPCHFVFDYNSSVAFSIFIIFLPAETGRNTVQFSYLTGWWRDNSITMHVTKVYFIQLVIKIKDVEFEDNTKHFY